jgi:hypothetical protein
MAEKTPPKSFDLDDDESFQDDQSLNMDLDAIADFANGAASIIPTLKPDEVEKKSKTASTSRAKKASKAPSASKSSSKQKPQSGIVLETDASQNTGAKKRSVGRPRLSDRYRRSVVSKLVRIDEDYAELIQEAADMLQRAPSGRGNFNRMLRLILREYFEPRR